jgi:hypothetical protein
MEAISERQLDALVSLFCCAEISDKWFMRHAEIKMDDGTHTITVKISDMDEQDYGEFKEK